MLTEKKKKKITTHLSTKSTANLSCQVMYPSIQVQRIHVKFKYYYVEVKENIEEGEGFHIRDKSIILPFPILEKRANVYKGINRRKIM